MGEHKIERDGNRAVIRSQGNGPYEYGILIEVNPLSGSTELAMIRYNHRTLAGGGEVAREWETVLPAEDWILIGELVREIMYGGMTIGDHSGVAQPSSGTSKPVPDALPAKSKPKR